MIAIQTKNLTKSYGDKKVVKGLDLEIEEGELFALLGVNGAGKTTTIKMLSCLLKPDGGTCEVLGHSVTNDPETVKHLIGVSPQETAVAPNLTVTENLEMIAGIYGFSHQEALERTKEMLEKFSLEDVKGQKAKTLSGGYQRRLSIAMGLVSKPQVMFLDEPTLGLDVLARRELWSVIEALKGEITMILTTHYLEEAESLSDRIGILYNGSLRCTGTPQEIKAAAGTDNFEDAFVKLATGGKES